MRVMFFVVDIEGKHGLSLLKEILLMPSVRTAGLELIVFQFNPHILKRFNGVINCRDKGDASSDSVQKSLP